ncbi:MAG: CRISPR-associated endonuclease Cas2 [Chloroflexi bacterium]|nr:CRISPR-associated endonuclease Cas2 [Chloroflexota bacterium]
MYVLVTYDVATIDKPGRRRLRRIARACLDWGQRVQFSVFEVELEKAQWVALRARLLSILDNEQDSIRFYVFDANVRDRVEHHGVREPRDLRGPLIA